MQNADLMILPSRTEGWPTVILEAYASGLFVIAADVGGVSEALSGQEGLVAQGKGFVERFSACIVSRISNDTIDTTVESERLRDWAGANTWLHVARREADVLENLLV